MFDNQLGALGNKSHNDKGSPSLPKRMNLRKSSEGGVKGRLELIQKFIRFVRERLP